ncbi:hypothetical protein A4G19_04265 [Pasteurellaceae bacterium Macca]|nr:hypothetical protein [Pasteurellaceae bacterium Macca]
MPNEIMNVFHKVFHKQDTAMTDSQRVATVFGKRHADVLRAIESLDCSPEFSQRNFAFANYIDEQGKKRPLVQMTQDGFTFLVMGFRGKKAAGFKEAFIAEFNRMKQWIESRAHIKHDQHRLNDAVKLHLARTGKYDPHAYARENNLIYLIALGNKRKAWLVAHGYPEDDEIRQHLNERQLMLVDELLSENAVMIKLGMPYSERKIKLEQSALYVLRQQA